MVVQLVQVLKIIDTDHEADGNITELTFGKQFDTSIRIPSVNINRPKWTSPGSWYFFKSESRQMYFVTPT
jgi:hypothetical protein